jgi:beta-lactamase regulating signal transducer with metallopeptidase domain/biopolymer transport protein ExbD
MEALSTQGMQFLVDITFKGTALSLVAFVVALTWRNAAGRALTWSVLLTTLLLLPLVVALAPEVSLQGYAVPAAVTAAAPMVAAAITVDEPSGQQIPWMTIALGLYLAGVAIGLGRIVAAEWHARRLRLSARPLSSDQLDAWRQRLGVRAQVEWASTSVVRTPALVGLWRPLILVPDTSVQDSSLLEATLAHELTHVQRGDLLWNLIGMLATSLYWFHPMVHHARRQWRLNSECFCDDSAVLHLGDANWYSNILLATARAAVQPAAPVLHMARSEGVTMRIERLLQGGTGWPREGRSPVRRSFATVMLLSGMCGCLGGLHPADTATTMDTTQAEAEVLAGGIIRLNGSEVAIADLQQAAVSLHWETGSSRIRIHGAENALHGDVVRVMDVARRAGFVDQVIDVKPVVDISLQPKVMIELLDEDHLLLDGQGLSFADFPVAAKELQAQTGRALIIIQQHQQSAATVGRVMDVVRRSGFQDMIIASDGPMSVDQPGSSASP